MVCLVVWIQQQAYLHFDHFGFVYSLKNCATIPNCIEYMKSFHSITGLSALWGCSIPYSITLAAGLSEVISVFPSPSKQPKPQVVVCCTT